MSERNSNSYESEVDTRPFREVPTSDSLKETTLPTLSSSGWFHLQQIVNNYLSIQIALYYIRNIV